MNPNQIKNDPLPTISETLLKSLAEMEKYYDENNKEYFKDLLSHPSHIIRTRAVCVFANMAGDDSVESLGHILELDPDALVRHEAAFSLGQLGFESSINPLSHAVESDPSFFVRHEAAIALGVIGSEKAREALIRALGDSSEEVRESALIALANLEYISTMRRKNKFTKMTGG
ncbi:MAG: HEAT repeat domain-containing protein [Nitrososphaeraceae archaeon]